MKQWILLLIFVVGGLITALIASYGKWWGAPPNLQVIEQHWRYQMHVEENERVSVVFFLKNDASSQFTGDVTLTISADQSKISQAFAEDLWRAYPDLKDPGPGDKGGQIIWQYKEKPFTQDMPIPGEQVGNWTTTIKISANLYAGSGKFYTEYVPVPNFIVRHPLRIEVQKMNR